jgi:cytochrome P450 family 110
MFFGALRRSFLPGWRRFVEGMDRLRAALQQQIDDRRAGGDAGADILGLMLAARDEAGQPMTDAEIQDELLTMIAAGHETTALSLAWAMFEIHRSPEVERTLGEEISALGPSPEPEALARLPYLGAVCDEAMRLRPVLGMAPRRLVRPFRLRGWDLSEGVSVAASIKLAHASPETYPEPEQFRPQRFLDRKPSPFEFLPFGGGSRRCLGAAFAAYEMRIVLGSLLAHHRFSLLSSAVPRMVRRNVTEGPEGGIPMIYEGSRAAVAARPSPPAAVGASVI